MGTKIDLDEIERKARAADPALWSGLRADAFNVDRWSDDRSVANAQHIALNSPPVTLALIARIRELENALRGSAEGWESAVRTAAEDEGGGLTAEQYDPESTLAIAEHRAILEKGAVLL